METFKLRKKLVRQFDDIIKNDSKLIALEGVFDALESTNYASIIPDEHYNMINESRESYFKGELKGTDWEEIKQNLISKYGL